MLDSYRAKLQIGVVDNTISDGASIMSRSSRSSFSRSTKVLLGIGKFKFGANKKKNNSDEAVVLMDDVVPAGAAEPAASPAAAGRDRRLSM